MSASPRLVALRTPRAAVGATLRTVWDAGDAALLLDPDAPDAAIEAIVERLRPAMVWDLVADRTAPKPARHTALSTEVPTGVRDAPGPAAALPSDAALVVTTSGSTGRPRGVVLTHAALGAVVDASCRALGVTPGDRWGLCLPTHHVAGVTVWLRAWWAGHDPIILEGDAARSADAALEAGIAFVSLVPTQLRRWLDADPASDGSTWPTVLLGGAAAPPELLARAAAAGVRVVTSYGMTETCGGCVYDGRPLDGVEVRTDADGRIALRGPVLAAGFLDAGGVTPLPRDADGWWTTNDLGRWTAGVLEVTGRADDVVISGGENVSLAAVRDVLAAHPGVADVVVVGRDDPVWGTRVVAVVHAAAGHTPSLDELREHVAGALPRSWAPRELLVVDALPRDGLGKVPRAALAQLLDPSPQQADRTGHDDG